MCHVVGSLFIVLFLLFIIAGQISNFTVMCEISSFKFGHDVFFGVLASAQSWQKKNAFKDTQSAWFENEHAVAEMIVPVRSGCRQAQWIWGRNFDSVDV